MNRVLVARNFKAALLELPGVKGFPEKKAPEFRDN